MTTPDPRDYDLRRLTIDAQRLHTNQHRRYLITFQGNLVVAWHDEDGEPTEEKMCQAVQNEIGYTGVTVNEAIAWDPS